MRLLAFLAIVLVAGNAHAQGIQAVQPIPGFQCLAVANPDVPPPVLQSPSATAPHVGMASAVIIAAQPVQGMNGYVKVMHLDGRQGWIEAGQLRPWHSVANPTATCTPAIMSDGKPGFRFGGS